MSHIQWLLDKYKEAQEDLKKAKYRLEVIKEIIDLAIENEKKESSEEAPLAIEQVSEESQQIVRTSIFGDKIPIPRKKPNRVITPIYSPITTPVKNYIKSHWDKDKPLTVFSKEIFDKTGYNIHHKTLKKYIDGLRGSIAGNEKKREKPDDSENSIPKNIDDIGSLVLIKEEALVERLPHIGEVDPKTPIVVNGKPTTVEEWKKQANLVNCNREDMKLLTLEQCKAFQNKWIVDPKKLDARIQLQPCQKCPNRVFTKESENVQAS